MLKKVKDWIGPSLDVYKVENANDVGDTFGKVRRPQAKLEQL